MPSIKHSLPGLAARDYRDAPLGFVGNLRRSDGGSLASCRLGPPPRAATAPAGRAQRLRDAFWRLLARCAPTASARSALRARCQMREFSRTVADLLGAMTTKGDAEGSRLRHAFLREASIDLGRLFDGCQIEDADIEAVVTPILRRHLQRLTGFDQHKILTSAPMDLSDGAWPDKTEQALGKRIMACVEKASADLLVVPALRTAVKIWGRSADRSPFTDETAAWFRAYFDPFGKMRLPLQPMMLLALKQVPDSILDTLRTDFSLTATGNWMSSYARLQWFLAHQGEAPMDENDARLLSCLRMATQQALVCRHAMTPQARRQLLDSFGAGGAGTDARRCARAWTEAVRAQLAHDDFSDFSGMREMGQQRAFSILAAHELACLDSATRRMIIRHLDTPTLQRMMGMAAPTDLDSVIAQHLDASTSPSGIATMALSVVDRAIEQELMRRKDRLADLQSMASTLERGARALPLADRLRTIMEMIELSAGPEAGADLASGEAAEQRMDQTLARLLDEALWACQHGPRGGRKELGAQDAGLWPREVLAAVLDLAELATRHGWKLDLEALRAVLPMRIQEAREAATEQLQIHFTLLRQPALPESSALLDSWARVVAQVGDWMRLLQRDRRMFGVDERFQAYSELTEAAIGDWWLMRRPQSTAAISHMESLLGACVTALGTATSAHVDADGAMLIERLNLLAALLATTLHGADGPVQPRGLERHAPDPLLQEAFERAIVRMEKEK